MLSRGTWWGWESGRLRHQGGVRFKSFGAKPRNQGKSIGSRVPGRESLWGKIWSPSKHPESGNPP